MALSCSTEASSSEKVSPEDTALVEKLQISGEDWSAIQALVSSKHGAHDVVGVEKSPTGLIGVWLAPLPGRAEPTGGPVYFYYQRNGAWFELDEMSAWGDSD